MTLCEGSIMITNRVLYIMIFVVMIMCIQKNVYSAFDGDENDFDAVVKYLKHNIDDYYHDLSQIKSSDKRREVIELRKEMERLVLKIDAGDIKDEELRKKIIALRRIALKKRSRTEFVINNFDRPGTNQLGGKMGTEFDGEYLYTSPWLMYSFHDEEKRVGKKVIVLEYDITEGPVLFFNEVKIHYPFKKYNALGFKIKSDSNTILMQLECEKKIVHDYVVSELTRDWQTIIIPFEKFSNYELFDSGKITRINFVLDDAITETLSGTFSLNDLILKNIEEKGAQIVPHHVIAYEVEGAVPLGTNKSFIQQK